ncbi:unnamed protein product, partial [Nesidiocoris tenuis]
MRGSYYNINSATFLRANKLDQQGKSYSILYVAGYEIAMDDTFYSSIYASFIILLFIFALARGAAFVLSSFRCSKNIHGRMVQSSLYTDVSYFNNNPSGRPRAGLHSSQYKPARTHNNPRPRVGEISLQCVCSTSESKRKPPKGWPSKGDIEFEGLSLRFAENAPPVLKNVSVQIHAGEKIGIVGRTGAGKSSLSTALFRLAPIEGRVLVDNVDTQRISLGSLRSALAIIPQNPVLFSGNLRSNLDPNGEYSDHELWAALGDLVQTSRQNLTLIFRQ